MGARELGAFGGALPEASGAYGFNPPELRAYQPSWRDRIALALQNVLPEQTVEGLMGSRGLGPTQRNAGIGLVDFTPAGIPLAVNEAQRSGEAGDWAGATVNAMAMVPGAKAGTKLLKEGIEGVLDEGAKAASHVDMPLFHGSPTYSGGMYDVGHQPRTDSGYLGGGMYLTPQEWIAKEYAKPLKGSQTPGHITQHRVKEGRFKDFVYDDKYVETLERFAKTLGVDAPFNTPRWAKEFGDAMRAAGYDGARGLNTDGTIAEMVLYDPNKMLAIEKPPGIRAYHGSPHDFDKFDLSKIGTGEGAQAYGHGLYFAENEGVAKQYKERLGGEPKVGGKSIWDNLSYMGRMEREKSIAALKNAMSEGLTGDDAVKAAITELNELGHEAGKRGEHMPYYTAANNLQPLIGKKWESPPGRTYEVSINAHPDEFLDWDKPLSEQPKAVQDTLTGMLKRYYSGQDYSRYAHNYKNMPAGEVLMEAQGRHATSERTTEELHAAGIKGIRYKDAGSRLPDWKILSPSETTTGKWRVHQMGKSGKNFDTEAEARAFLNENAPTSNYVVFSDDIIQILRKYGIAGLTAGGVAGMAAGSPTDAQAKPSLYDVGGR